MNHNIAFGIFLRQQRKKNMQSQEALAFDAGLDRTYISLLELGRKSPTLDTILALCQAMKLQFSELALEVEAIIESDN
ncbi:helix-turn-helix transcriptional regulator [Janthinobacterium sp. CAN_S7]|uniref:helix-turn-helix domain-containing protein n=1 Tax=Janthinobacterium sp. CAN_S7 TaxID=3071704 RepID=UPI00319DF7F7